MGFSKPCIAGENHRTSILGTPGKGGNQVFLVQCFFAWRKNHGGKWDLIKNDEEMTSNTLKDHVQTFVKNKTNLV